MATYKPIRKTASGTEEIKIPYAVIADPPTIPDISGKANLAGNNTFTGGQTITGQTSDGYSVNASGYVKGSWLQSGVKSNHGSGTGMVCVFDGSGWIYYRTPSEILTEAGGAKASDIPAAVTESTVSGWGFTKNKGTVTSVAVKMNGETKGTVTSSGTIDLGTVITADGGTINKSKTVKMDASANSNGANLKWGTVNSKNPYIGYASDQTDGTFVVGSLLGTNYASGLAIGGGSGNLLWKGAKVATTSDIPNISGKLDKTAFSLSGTTLTITI